MTLAYSFSESGDVTLSVSAIGSEESSSKIGVSFPPELLPPYKRRRFGRLGMTISEIDIRVAN
jgi:hypothetical protein